MLDFVSDGGETATDKRGKRCETRKHDRCDGESDIFNGDGENKSKIAGPAAVATEKRTGKKCRKKKRGPIWIPDGQICRWKRFTIILRSMQPNELDQ